MCATRTWTYCKPFLRIKIPTFVCKRLRRCFLHLAFWRPRDACCRPSSVKRIIAAGLISTSVSLGLQALLAVLLCLRLGTRLQHQIACSAVIIGLIVSVSTILPLPPHLQSMCFNIPSTPDVTVKAALSPGSQRPPCLSQVSPARCVTPAAGWLLVASLLAQIFCLVVNHPLLAASVQPAGTTLPASCCCCCLLPVCAVTGSVGVAAVSYGWLK
jgi:hypothetical protein